MAAMLGPAGPHIAAIILFGPIEQYFVPPDDIRLPYLVPPDKIWLLYLVPLKFIMAIALYYATAKKLVSQQGKL